MVPEFVCDHVSLSKIRSAAADPAEFVPEAEVDVDLLVGRTVEGTRLRLRDAAARLCVVTEEYEMRWTILPSRLLRQKLCPCP